MRGCVTVSAMVSAGKVSRLPNSRSVAAEAVQGRVPKPSIPPQSFEGFSVMAKGFSAAIFLPSRCH